MENLISLVAAGVGGLVVGFLVAKMTTKPAVPTLTAEASAEVEWWKVRETLTGTQLQILQYLEAKKSASITQLQEKFSFIPDRELYYRLEQIVLMQFVIRGRRENEVIYDLNEDYSGTVEDDKTVIMTGE